MLIRELGCGDSIMIGNVKIVLLKKSGQKARIGIEASKEIPIKANESRAEKERK